MCPHFAIDDSQIFICDNYKSFDKEVITEAFFPFNRENPAVPFLITSWLHAQLKSSQIETHIIFAC